MKYPVNYIGISQGLHYGKCIDFGWNSKYGGYNQPVLACASGIVKKIEYQRSGGNVIYIEHNDKLISCYAHLKNKSIKVKVNDQVKMGDEIALMGNTGTNSSGNHLHFALYKSINDIYKPSTINPFDYLYVYKDQVVGSTTKEKYKKDIKYFQEDIKYIYHTNYQGLNVRNKPSLNSNIIDIIPPGTKVNVISYVDNFANISPGKWVYKTYLTKTIPKLKEVKSLKIPPLNVRSGPSTNYRVIGSIPPGFKVYIYAKYKGWSKISYKDQTWVSSNYLK